jgi:hypothetical protein
MYVLLRWDIGHWVVGEWKSDSTLLLTSLSVCYPQVRLLDCLPRELALHFTVSLQTVLVMWTLQLSLDVYYLTEHILFECLGENVGLHSVIIPKRFLKIRFSCLWPTHDHKKVPNDNFLFTVNSIFLSGNILDAYNKKGNWPIIHAPW